MKKNKGERENWKRRVNVTLFVTVVLFLFTMFDLLRFRIYGKYLAHPRLAIFIAIATLGLFLVAAVARYSNRGRR